MELSGTGGQEFTLAPVGIADIVEPKTLTIWGNLVQSNPVHVLASGSVATPYGVKDNTLTRLILRGKGIVEGGLKNSLFDDVFSITVGRAESLGGDLTMDNTNGANLTIQTGTNNLDLAGYKLTLSDEDRANPTSVTIISGGILANASGSTVDFLSNDILPANMFIRSEVSNVLFGSVTAHPEVIEIRGDVKILNNLNIAVHGTEPLRIVTGTNILTLGPQATHNLDANHYVVGNLVMTTTNLSKQTYPVGTFKKPDGYAPVTMKFNAPNTSQEMLVTVVDADPASGRAGNADNTINFV